MSDLTLWKQLKEGKKSALEQIYRTYRELKIQRLLEHENVLGIKRILKPKDRESFNEIYVVSELMETDLAQIIKSN